MTDNVIKFKQREVPQQDPYKNHDWIMDQLEKVFTKNAVVVTWDNDEDDELICIAMDNDPEMIKAMLIGALAMVEEDFKTS